MGAARHQATRESGAHARTARAHRARFPSRPRRRWLEIYAVGLGLVLLVVWLRGQPVAGRELVLNPSAAANLSDWQASSDVGDMTLSRVTIAHGPTGESTAVEVRRRGPGGKWAFVLSGLRRPERSFRRGHAYRMQAYVRDLNASNQSIGLLLANGNFAHQPTSASEYARYVDDAWHLVQRTFVARGPGKTDTGVYFEMPLAGPLHWEITGVSVQPVNSAASARTAASPSRVLSFDGPAGSPPDAAEWNYDLGGNGWGGGDLQTYTRSASNASLDGRGNLVLTARREDVTGVDGRPRHYSSARLQTIDKVSVPPGSYVEASLRAPAGAGVLPAFWLLGANFSRVGWPACGELDVMEGTSEGASTVMQSVHAARLHRPTVDAPFSEYAHLASPRDTAFHRYGVYFDDQLVRFFVDGRPSVTLTRRQAFEHGQSWPFGQPQNIVLNVAVTGSPGAGALPASQVVSRISIWRGGVPVPAGSVPGSLP